ncbi:MAG: Spy/CpxP family protein refolding chaperone [Armatimonadota bacterium]|nr:Spy/CpxP family protein refolding chaperone [Armatimonadota bacterium]MDR7533771.1 Spy/CpxP family protein refolding chaperone [Armatimonadota bacterium]
MASVVVVALVAGGLTAAAAAGPWDDEGPIGADDVAPFLAQAAPAAPAPPGAGPALRRRLNLTDEQARRVEQIAIAFRSRTARLRIDLARARLDAREALLESTPDRARLEAIARRIGELHGQLARARFEMLVELKAVLTPEQWMRLQTLRWGRGVRGLRR